MHSGNRPGFVFSRNALHQVPDFWKGIALTGSPPSSPPVASATARSRVRLRAGGGRARIAAWLAGAVDDPARGWTADELAEHVRIEHSTYSWLFEPLLERTGFEILERAYVRGAYGAYTCRRR